MLNSIYRKKIHHNTLEILSLQVAVEAFDRLNRRARSAYWWSRLVGRPGTLLAFEPERLQILGVSAWDCGICEIPVRSIRGSLSQSGEYDRQFRPLNPGLKSRWINVFVLGESLGWKPVIVHKIGEIYYVEDGHHRVSVARHSGMTYIEGRVIDYPQGE
jgi:hypothetical protein